MELPSYLDFSSDVKGRTLVLYLVSKIEEKFRKIKVGSLKKKLRVYV